MAKNNRSEYHCTNPNCKNHNSPEPKFFIKKGYYTTKHNSKKVPMYQCKHCGKKFSSHSFSEAKGQHKPEINNLVFKFYASNLSQNRLARDLGVNRKTIVRKIRWLAAKARKIHESVMPKAKLQMVQFDEMETFEHTRMKPVSVAIAVECYWDSIKQVYRTGRIVDAIAAPMYYKSRNAKKAQEKYGDREDLSDGARNDVAEAIKAAAGSPNIRILTDGKRSYGNLFAKVMPQSRLEIIDRKKNSGSEYDRMFSLNHTCARLRHDMSRMARQSWVTTKNVQGLQDHLDLFIAYYNQYAL